MAAASRQWLVPLLCLGTALSAGATPLAACDPAWLPVARPDGISIFVALALTDTVLDTVTGPFAARIHPRFAARLDAIAGQSSGGQRVRLPRSDAVLVPWAYGSDCRPIAWSGPLGWIPPGTRGAVSGWLRPREHWIEGLPTFDIEMAWREPMWVPDEPRWFGGTGNDRLTPEEFVELYAALPTTGLLERSPDEAAGAMRSWERSHPALAGRPPARKMLDSVYRAAAERSGRPAPPAPSG
jgi:hypothetical protein